MAMIMVGVCAVLWGKEGDEEENSEEKFLVVVKCCKGFRNNSLSMPRINEVDVEMQSTGSYDGGGLVVVL